MLRRAVEELLSHASVTAQLTASTGTQMRVVTDLPTCKTENANPVVETPMYVEYPEARPTEG